MSPLSTRCDRRKPRRRGLAPLELVLCLPILLFTMALMVSFGAAAAWKVKSLNAARQGVWRARAAWNGGSDPRIDGLPASASMGRSSASDLNRASQYWDVGAITHPVVRGPRISGQGQNSDSGYIALRDRRYFEMSEGVRRGTSHFERHYALLPKSGRFSYDLAEDLLDSRWQFHSQGFPWNSSRRAKGWYNFEDAPEWASEKARFLAADLALVSNPTREDLKPLDRDDEFRDWYGNFREFHALLSGCRPRRPNCGPCELEVSVVRQQNVQRLIEGIQGPNGGGRNGIPDRMARAWIAMYESMIRYYESQQPPDVARIQQLQELIDQLTEFRGTLN